MKIKKRYLIWVVVLWFTMVCMINPLVHGAFTSYDAKGDCRIYEDLPNTNYNAQRLDVQSRDGNRDMRTVIEFSEDNFSEIPSGATISDATLSLYYYDRGNNNPVGRTYNIHSLIGNFTESEVTWNSRKTGVGWTWQGGYYNLTVLDTMIVPASYGWVSWNVTVWIREVVNNGSNDDGFIIKDNAEESATNYNARFYNHTHLGGKNPMLNITYTVPASAPVIESIYPPTNTIDLCPCCVPVNITVSTPSGVPVTIKLETNASGSGNFKQISYDWAGCGNGSYATCVFNFTRFNYNYWLRVTASTVGGTTSQTLKYTTTSNVNCSVVSVNLTNYYNKTESDSEFLSAIFDMNTPLLIMLFVMYLFFMGNKFQDTFMVLISSLMLFVMSIYYISQFSAIDVIISVCFIGTGIYGMVLSWKFMQIAKLSAKENKEKQDYITP